MSSRSAYFSISFLSHLTFCPPPTVRATSPPRHSSPRPRVCWGSGWGGDPPSQGGAQSARGALLTRLTAGPQACSPQPTPPASPPLLGTSRLSSPHPHCVVEELRGPQETPVSFRLGCGHRDHQQLLCHQPGIGARDPLTQLTPRPPQRAPLTADPLALPPTLLLSRLFFFFRFPLKLFPTWGTLAPVESWMGVTPRNSGSVHMRSWKSQPRVGSGRGAAWFTLCRAHGVGEAGHPLPALTLPRRRRQAREPGTRSARRSRGSHLG